MTDQIQKQKHKQKQEALQTGEKREVSTDAERTRPGAVFAPAVDIFETASEITVLADMPGVTTDHLDIDLREGVLTLEGRVDAPEARDQRVVAAEYLEQGTFFRRFSLSDAIDQAKIEATLRDGVLRVRLPKVEKAQPRQIVVKTG